MKRIVVTGPESTGKSTLCRQLAERYGTVWCPEYAREYLTQKGTHYTYEDLDAIARGQHKLEQEKQAEVRNGLYFIDTDPYVMKVWHEVAFGACPTWILKTIARTRYDLYLLCNTDLPWTEYHLREYPEAAMRERLFRMYLDVVQNSGTPWAVVSGSGKERLEKASEAVETLKGKRE